MLFELFYHLIIYVDKVNIGSLLIGLRTETKMVIIHINVCFQLMYLLFLADYFITTKIIYSKKYLIIYVLNHIN